jgi:predicted Zn-dependent protease
MAFQSRSGDAALQAARDWKRAFPQSREANRYVLQILVALNRCPRASSRCAPTLRCRAQGPPAAISAIPRNFARVTDKKQAATVVEQALSEYTAKADLGPAAWTTIGRMRLAAGDAAGAWKQPAAGRR